MTVKEFFSFRQNKYFWVNIIGMAAAIAVLLFGVLKGVDLYTRHDMLSGQSAFVANYSEEEKIDFLAYLDKQIDRIDLVDKDASFLRGKMLLMYANPLTNYLHSVEASAGK